MCDLRLKTGNNQFVQHVQNICTFFFGSRLRTFAALQTENKCIWRRLALLSRDLSTAAVKINNTSGLAGGISDATYIDETNQTVGKLSTAP